MSIRKEYHQHFKKRGFKLKEKIGSGLSGNTIKGFQESLKRDVAIKFFDSKLHVNNPKLKQRFLRESKLLSKLQHPSIPYVITDGSVPVDNIKIPYIIMQYISNITLEEYIKKYAPLPLEIVLKISTQILDTLNFVHENKIIHRDIKPSNIMLLTPSNHCYLIDFSIGVQSTSEQGLTRVTTIGEGLGTDRYMSPEQRGNMKDVDGRTDIYSYALIMCELLTKEPDIRAFEKVKNEHPIELNDILHKALSYNIDDRFHTANDFLVALNSIFSNTSFRQRKPSNAFCLNIKCPSADWSENGGYYRKPYILTDSISKYCNKCGEELTYQCKKCGRDINDEQFCGNCGTEIFTIPKCKKCNSWLTLEDMDKDTEKNGCTKCRRKEKEKKQQQPQQPLPYGINIYSPTPSIEIDEDEIPF